MSEQVLRPGDLVWIYEDGPARRRGRVKLLGNATGPLVIVPEDVDLVDAEGKRWSWRGGYTQPEGGAHYWTPNQIAEHAGPIREDIGDE